MSFAWYHFLTYEYEPNGMFHYFSNLIQRELIFAPPNDNTNSRASPQSPRHRLARSLAPRGPPSVGQCCNLWCGCRPTERAGERPGQDIRVSDGAVASGDGAPGRLGARTDGLHGLRQLREHSQQDEPDAAEVTARRRLWEAAGERASAAGGAATPGWGGLPDWIEWCLARASLPLPLSLPLPSLPARIGDMTYLKHSSPDLYLSRYPALRGCSLRCSSVSGVCLSVCLSAV